jgi:uncharacterized protein (DUF1697 family)
MKTYVALLRAVNVGGTGRLPMSALRQMCEEVGLKQVRTYIASGNVVFKSDTEEAEIKSALEGRLQAYAGKPVGVLVRSAREMAAVLARNPFPGEPGNRTVALFVDDPFPPMHWTMRPGCGESSFAWESAKFTFSMAMEWRIRACASPRGMPEPPAT